MKKSNPARTQLPALTAEQEVIKQLRLPRAPDDLSKTERLLFEAAVNKIRWIPTDSGALIIDESALTEEELFALGRSLFDPPSVIKKLRNLKRRGQLSHPNVGEVYDVFLQVTEENNPDLFAAEIRSREMMRDEILVNARGQQFPIGRRQGAIGPIHKYLRGLYKRISPEAFEDFWNAIDGECKNQVGDDLIILQEIDGTTLHYFDRKGRRDKKIHKRTIENAMNRYKKI
jgi:hypothetical protein